MAGYLRIEETPTVCRIESKPILGRREDLDSFSTVIIFHILITRAHTPSKYAKSPVRYPRPSPVAFTQPSIRKLNHIIIRVSIIIISYRLSVDLLSLAVAYSELFGRLPCSELRLRELVGRLSCREEPAAPLL
jgi:hypothetical protein